MTDFCEHGVGSTAWLAGIKTVLSVYHARLQGPLPPSNALQRAVQRTIGELVELQKRSEQACRTDLCASNDVDRLRDVYHNRLRVLERLSVALEKQADDDLYAILGTVPENSISEISLDRSQAQPHQQPSALDRLKAKVEHSLAEVASPLIAAGDTNSVRTSALEELRHAAQILAGLDSIATDSDDRSGAIDGSQTMTNLVSPPAVSLCGGISPGDDPVAKTITNLLTDVSQCERALIGESSPDPAEGGFKVPSFEALLELEADIAGLIRLEEAWIDASRGARESFRNRIRDAVSST